MDSSVVVAFLARELEQLVRAVEVVGQLAEHLHDAFQRLLFLAQVLGALGVVPDVGVFQPR
jgi:hypothetical protein